MVVAFWLTTLLLRQWHGIASRSRTASPPWRLRRFSSLPRNRLIRLGNCDGRGFLAYDAAASSVARACFALPGGFAAMAPSALSIATEKSIDSTRSVPCYRKRPSGPNVLQGHRPCLTMPRRLTCCAEELPSRGTRPWCTGMSERAAGIGTHWMRFIRARGMQERAPSTRTEKVGQILDTTARAT